MKQTKKAVHAIKQSIFLDVFGWTFISTNIDYTEFVTLSKTTNCAFDKLTADKVSWSNPFSDCCFLQKVILQIYTNF